MGYQFSANDTLEITIGCVVCDVEDEQTARDLMPDEKVPRRYYNETERDEALERLYSGAAYREHEERRQEIKDESEANAAPKRSLRHGNVKPKTQTQQHFEDEDY
jgi:hypothetical protein